MLRKVSFFYFFIRSPILFFLPLIFFLISEGVLSVSSTMCFIFLYVARLGLRMATSPAQLGLWLCLHLCSKLCVTSWRGGERLRSAVLIVKRWQRQRGAGDGVRRESNQEEAGGGRTSPMPRPTGGEGGALVMEARPKKATREPATGLAALGTTGRKFVICFLLPCINDISGGVDRESTTSPEE